MGAKNKRNIFLSPQKQQERILVPFYAACLIAIICVCSLVLLDYPLGHIEQGAEGLIEARITPIKVAKIVMGLLATGVFGLLIYWAFILSNRTVGAYERILRELDEIILGQKKGPLHVRDADDMFAELLHRINIFIEDRREYRDQLIDELIKRRLKVKSFDPKDYFRQDRG